MALDLGQGRSNQKDDPDECRRDECHEIIMCVPVHIFLSVLAVSNFVSSSLVFIGGPLFAFSLVCLCFHRGTVRNSILGYAESGCATLKG